MFTLVRDNYPKLIEEANSNSILNYAVIQNKDLLMAFLRQKLADEVNIFLGNDGMTLDKLIDIELILATLREESAITQEMFDAAYAESIEKLGKFDKKYIVFYAENPSSPEETSTASEVESTPAEN